MFTMSKNYRFDESVLRGLVEKAGAGIVWENHKGSLGTYVISRNHSFSTE